MYSSKGNQAINNKRKVSATGDWQEGLEPDSGCSLKAEPTRVGGRRLMREDCNFKYGLSMETSLRSTIHER